METGIEKEMEQPNRGEGNRCAESDVGKQEQEDQLSIYLVPRVALTM